MKYAHRKYVVTIHKADEDGTLLTQFSQYPIKKNELYAVDSFGSAFPIDEDNFNKNYIPVQVKSTRKAKQLSPFEEQYYKEAFEEMSKLDQNEQQEYIEGMKDLVENKPL